MSKYLNKKQKAKADKIAQLIIDLKKDGVSTFMLSNSLHFSKEKLQFGEFPNEDLCYEPNKKASFENYCP